MSFSTIVEQERHHRAEREAQRHVTRRALHLHADHLYAACATKDVGWEAVVATCLAQMQRLLQERG